MISTSIILENLKGLGNMYGDLQFYSEIKKKNCGALYNDDHICAQHRHISFHFEIITTKLSRVFKAEHVAI